MRCYILEEVKISDVVQYAVRAGRVLTRVVFPFREGRLTGMVIIKCIHRPSSYNFLLRFITSCEVPYAICKLPCTRICCSH